jgi:hypothetical protein
MKRGLQPDAPGLRLRHFAAHESAPEADEQCHEKGFPLRRNPLPLAAMITFLEGTLVEALPTYAVIDVHGVGYMLHIPLSSYEKLPPAGQHIKMLTHLSIREDAHVLFGFASSVERDLFRLLITHVSGIGSQDRARCPFRHQRGNVQGGGGGE